MNRRRFAALPGLVSVLLCCTGCFVKEDRDICPCLLTLEFPEEGRDRSGRVEVAAGAGSGAFLYSEEVDLRSYGIEVPKAMVRVVASYGDGAGFSAQDGLRIAPGKECPEVLLHSSWVDARRETCRENIDFHKDWCKVTVSMLAKGPVYPFSLVVRGEVDGFCGDRRPHGGYFEHRLELDRNGKAHVNVPRQVDNSLVLQIVDQDQVLREFSLGQFIDETGFDWMAEDLKDVEVTVDYARSEISVEVMEWEGAFGFEVVI